MNNTNLFNEFINSEDLEIYKNNNIDNFTKYVTHRDLEIIFDGIDKTDYTYMGVSRWMYLEYILDKLINRKIQNPNLQLTKISIISTHEMFPPHIKYYLVFK